MLSGQAGPLRCELLPGVTLASDRDSVRLHFAEPLRALSTAVLNGGLCRAGGFLNLRVDRDGPVEPEDPELTLRRAAQPLFGDVATVGMMTAASMASLRAVRGQAGGAAVALALTAGLHNARRAGDPAAAPAATPPVGTINIAVVTSLALTDAALAEAMLVITEAKAGLLQEIGVRSPVSGLPATGTGTDALAVFCPARTPQVRYAGTHTALGELLARLAMRALRDSLLAGRGVAA